MDAKALFRIDPAAAVSYGEYQQLKGKGASFEDFLLHYDSIKANEDHSSYLMDMIKEEINDNSFFTQAFLASNVLGQKLSSINPNLAANSSKAYKSIFTEFFSKRALDAKLIG